jgi:hypothetical protein
MDATRIAGWEPSRRLTAGLFALLMLLFAGLAQANLWHQVGGGAPPGPEKVLWKYHGKPGATKLHQVLDMSLSQDDPHAMWPYAGATREEQASRVKQILTWVERGAPKDGWDALAPVFTGAETCGQCHSPGGLKQDLPLDSYEHVLPVTQPDTGMPMGQLFISAHNHFFAFAVGALLLSVLLTFTGLKPLYRTLLILAAFGGPVLDVGGWFLTKAFGAPFHLLVMAGGGMFGGALATMAAVIAWEAFVVPRRTKKA